MAKTSQVFAKKKKKHDSDFTRLVFEHFCCMKYLIIIVFLHSKKIFYFEHIDVFVNKFPVCDWVRYLLN